CPGPSSASGRAGGMAPWGNGGKPRSGTHRGDRARRTARPRPAVDHDRVERPDQPDVVRGVRVPGPVRVQPRHGHCPDAGRALQGQGGGLQRAAGADGVRRQPAARCRAVGHPAAALMEWVGRRGAGIVMHFDPADAQVLRGLVTGVRELVGGGGPDSGPDIGPHVGPDSGMVIGADSGPGVDPLEALVGIGQSTQAPSDPALARLLPDGYTDDAEAAGEFRRLTETSLRQHKSETAQRVLDSLPADGGRVCLDAEDTRAWLSALNDIRLVVGTRLDVTEEMDTPDPGDPAR